MFQDKINLTPCFFLALDFFFNSLSFYQYGIFGDFWVKSNCTSKIRICQLLIMRIGENLGKCSTMFS
jgi:hypothetical protein